MRFTLENIGKISEAAVEINGITVIAGENDTGKSTVGKALFAVLHAFYRSGQQAEDSRVESVSAMLRVMMHLLQMPYSFRAGSEKRARALVRSAGPQPEPERVRSLLNEMVKGHVSPEAEHSSAVEIAAEQIASILELDDGAILKRIVNDRLSAEFNGQITNLFSAGSSSSSTPKTISPAQAELMSR